MASAENKQLVMRYLGLYDGGDVERADAIIAADFVDHTRPEAPRGPAAVKRMVAEYAEFHTAFPDVVTTVEHMIGEGDIVAFRFTLTGTHRGSFAGAEATGKCVTVTGMDFVRIADDKIVELWSCQNTLSLLMQIGAVVWAKRSPTEK